METRRYPIVSLVLACLLVPSMLKADPISRNWSVFAGAGVVLDSYNGEHRTVADQLTLTQQLSLGRRLTGSWQMRLSLLLSETPGRGIYSLATSP